MKINRRLTALLLVLHNEDSIQLATYGSEYVIGSVAYSWDQTLRKVISSSAKNLE